ncbi:MAG: phosphotransferase [Parahaliea sp.]
MVATLPPDQQLRLKQTLAQWQQWHCPLPLTARPKVETLLTGGFSNISVKVCDSQNNAYVVRLNEVNQQSHGINRHCEWRAMQLASAAGIAPNPCYFNPKLDVLVSQYLHGAKKPAFSPRPIAALLRAIHKLPAIHCRLDLQQRIVHYQQQVQRQARAYWQQLKKFQAVIVHTLAIERSSPTRHVLCHNDLLNANRLYSNGLLFAIDWEYCAMGSPWFDLAIICHGDQLSQQDTSSLLTAYLQRSPEDEVYYQLARQGLLYRYIELLWHACVNPLAINWAQQLQTFGTLAEDRKALGLSG